MDQKNFVVQEFRKWGRSTAEALDYYKLLMKEAGNVLPEGRDRYIAKRLREYFDDLV